MHHRRHPVDVVLRRLASRWREIGNRISALHGDVVAGVGDDDLVRQSRDTLASLDRAIGRFEAAAKAPDVTIATTGTTSSGKSTLANLLIGEELLPKAVQEMSAGVVQVHHDPDTCALEVAETRGASWPTGRWNNIGAEDVRCRLEDTMAAYRRILGDGAPVDVGVVEPPRFVVRWPTRMGRSLAQFGLPAGTKLTVVDLPGLKFVNDEVNGAVVRDQVRKALCLVAYNSFETDPRKQAALLREVVDQVKALRGSPARMLFVLNRIDAFLKDRDPKASERDFSDRVTKQIRLGLCEALPEFADDVSTIEPIALSSEPALYALLAEQDRQDGGVALLRRLKKEYLALYPEVEMERLPGSPVDWSDGQRRWFLHETSRHSRFSDFEQKLRDHLTANLPELLLPELVERADAASRDALGVVDAIITAYGQQERAEVAKAKERLEGVHQTLRRLKSQAVSVLDPLREVADGDGDLMARLFVAVPEVERRLGIAVPSGGAGFQGTGPLAALCTALPDAVQEPLQRLNDLVVRQMGGESVDDSLLAGLGGAQRLVAAIEALRSGPYGRVWQAGGDFEGSSATAVAGALGDLASALAITAGELVGREAAVQADRMKGALDKCGAIIVGSLEAEAGGHAVEFQGLRGVFRGSFELTPPRFPPVNFSPDVRHWSRVEERYVTETYKATHYRWWDFLAFFPKEVQKTRMVLRTTETRGIEVSKLGDLLEAFAATGSRRTLESVFADWLVDGVAAFEKSLERRLDTGVKTYRTVLLKRMEEIEQGADTRISAVEVHLKTVRGIADDVGVARDWRRGADE